MFTVQFTAYSVQCTAYSVVVTVYSVQYTVYWVQYTVYTVYSVEILADPQPRDFFTLGDPGSGGNHTIDSYPHPTCATCLFRSMESLHVPL